MALASDALDAIDSALDAFLALDLAALPPIELAATTHRFGVLRSRVEACEAKVVGEFDAEKLWAGRGAKSPAAALARPRRVPASECRRAARLGRKLRQLPAVAAAWEAGAVQPAHVARIAKLDNPRTHDALVADQVIITRWAITLGWKAFCVKLAGWLEEHDLDGPEPGRSKRRFHSSRTIGDSFALEGWLDPVGGSVFDGELRRLESELYDVDRAEARARLGIDDPMPFQLCRTPAQRRADALVLMAERSAVEPGDSRRGTILLTVLVGHESLARILEVTNGIPLRAGQLSPFLDEATRVEGILFDGPRHVVGVSAQRNFQGVVRKAVQVRDRVCQHPECDEPIDRCQVDHVQPWSRGGPTRQENGRLLCGYHNRLRNGAAARPPRPSPRSAPHDGRAPPGNTAA